MIEVNRQGEVWVFAEQDRRRSCTTSCWNCAARPANWPTSWACRPEPSCPARTWLRLAQAADRPRRRQRLLRGRSAAGPLPDAALCPGRCAALIEKHKPQIVLYGATPLGRDLAPRVASEMRAGMTADCTDLEIKDVTDPRTKTRAREAAAADPPGVRRQHHRHDRQLRQVAADGHGPRRRDAAARSGPVAHGRRWSKRRSSWAMTLFAVKLIERHIEPRRVNLKGARVIVAGGGGVGSKDNFQLIHELAGRDRRGGGRQPRRGRRRLHRQGTPDRPDRHDRAAGAVHRRRHQRRGPAPGRHGRIGQDHRHQHRPAMRRSSPSPTTASSAI